MARLSAQRFGNGLPPPIGYDEQIAPVEGTSVDNTPLTLFSQDIFPALTGSVRTTKIRAEIYGGRNQVTYRTYDGEIRAHVHEDATPTAAFIVSKDNNSSQHPVPASESVELYADIQINAGKLELVVGSNNPTQGAVQWRGWIMYGQFEK